MRENRSLTEGGIVKGLFYFAAPMILGNLLQQCYNLADTYIVGRYLGKEALAAVGGTYALTTFLYSILTGFCMGCGALSAFACGKKDEAMRKRYQNLAFLIIGGIALLLEIGMLLFSGPVLKLLKIPEEILIMTDSYLRIILCGIVFIFLFQFFTYLARAVGDSLTPLLFLSLSAVLNIVLDIYLIAGCGMHVEGAALATLISQGISAIGLLCYCMAVHKQFRPHRGEWSFTGRDAAVLLRQSGMSSVQQSVMNFGILMVQGLVNSFGTVVMAAFTVAVKIDTIAYMPAQEFGNAYSLFVSQNLGAGKKERIRKGTMGAMRSSAVFCLLISALVFAFAVPLMNIFVTENPEVTAIGAQYLRIEGACYVGIGLLFLLYGYFRGMNRPEVSLLLTVISLGTRVLLAYILAAIPQIGVIGIWVSIPIGWILADVTGFLLLKKTNIYHLGINSTD